MDIKNKNELQTNQDMDSRHMQKSTILTKNIGRTLYSISINIVIDDRLTCNVNKVYMYMILVVSIYVFLITMGFLI